MTSAPTVVITPATSSGSRGPRLPVIRPDSGASSTVIAAIGSVYRPACSAERCRASWRYSVLRNRKPASAENALTAIKTAPVNGALRKNRRSSSGSARLVKGQPGRGERRDGEQPEDEARGPAPARPLDDRVGERGEHDDDQQLADRVHPAGVLGAGFRDDE